NQHIFLLRIHDGTHKKCLFIGPVPPIIRNPSTVGDRADNYGTAPGASSPALSSSPAMMLKHCTAWPAAPLTRLSIAASTTIVSPLPPGRCTAMRHILPPRTWRVSATLP